MVLDKRWLASLEGFDPRKVNWVGVIFSAAILTAALVVGFRFLDLLMAWWTYSSVFMTLKTATGLPDAITGAIAVWIVAGIVIWIPTLIHAAFFKKRKAVYIIATSLSVWMVVLYVLSLPARGQYFNPVTGTAYYKYSRQPDGSIQTFPLGYEYDPTYRNRLQLVTPEVVREINRVGEFAGLPRPDNAKKVVAVAKPHAPANIPPAIVKGDQNSWVTMTQVNEPLHVTVPPTDTIKPSDSSSYESNANGIFPEGLPSRYDSNMTVIAEDRKNHGMQLTRPGNLYELVGRVCEQGGCNPAMPMGTDSVVCPGGYLQAWYNGFSIVFGEHSTIRFNHGIGQYRLTIVPDEFAEKTCAAHPRESIIQTKGGRNN